MTAKWRATGADPEEKVINLRAAFAEFLAAFLFVGIGCGVACGNGASDGETRLLVAFAFGIAILVLAYIVGHTSGGQINCAVTLALVLCGKLPWYQGVANTFAQLFGSLVGAMFLAALFTCEDDMTMSLGSNIINPRLEKHQAFIGEVFGTFLLCMVVFQTAVSPASSAGPNAPIAIGFAVFLAHVLLLPIDGCSINPSRSFGPPILAAIRSCYEQSLLGLEDLWVMILGPVFGSILAATLHAFVLCEPSQVPKASEKDALLDDAPAPAIERVITMEMPSDSKVAGDERTMSTGTDDGDPKAAAKACI